MPRLPPDHAHRWRVLRHDYWHAWFECSVCGQHSCTINVSGVPRELEAEERVIGTLPVS